MAHLEPTEPTDPLEPAESPLPPEEVVSWPAPDGVEWGDVLSRLEVCVGGVLAGLRVGVGKMSRGGLLRTVQRLQGLLNRVQVAQVEMVAEFDRTARKPSTVAGASAGQRGENRRQAAWQEQGGEHHPDNADADDWEPARNLIAGVGQCGRHHSV